MPVHSDARDAASGDSRGTTRVVVHVCSVQCSVAVIFAEHPTLLPSMKQWGAPGHAKPLSLQNSPRERDAFGMHVILFQCKHLDYGMGVPLLTKAAA